ncbi:MAG: membrane protein insertase YidC [Propionibacterium sp.]|nr:membrane protein insertase YidC [Propionibacterium sp.]
MSFGGSIMYPLYWAVSGLLVFFHWIWAFVFGADSGATWTLSIISLTVFIRVLLIPIFVKQIRSSRNMQLVQPKLRELQKKYSHDRERLGQETMKLYRDEGINPMASCLPLLLQMPIFLALFQVLVGAANNNPRGYWIERTPELARSLSEATFFGAKISDRFLPFEWPLTHVHIVTVILIIGMTVTLFITQLQLMRKNMPPEALTGPMAQQQKMMLYLFPVIFAVGGVNFPIGVLIYWLTSNLWTMGQQFYIIRKNPAPGTPAYEAWEERQRKHGRDPEKMAAERAAKARKQRKAAEPESTTEPVDVTPDRTQPQHKPRAARQTKGAAVRTQPQRKSRAGRQPQSKKKTRR